MKKDEVAELLRRSGIQVENGKIAKADLTAAVSMIATAGYVSIKAQPGDKLRCINDKKYHRHYGTGPDWSVPEGVEEGKIYTVVRISEDYFGSNKLLLDVKGKSTVVDPLYMDGAKYGQRFENVANPGDEIARVI